MIKLLFLIPLLSAACLFQKNNPIIHNNKTTKSQSLKDSVLFYFTAKLDKSSKQIKVNATLENVSQDTIYFLSSSCDGEQYSLKYDTKLLFQEVFFHCNANWSVIMKIAPKEKHIFNSYFSSKQKLKSLELSFDFFKVDKDFQLIKKNKLNIHNRPLKDQNLLWYSSKIK